MIITKYSKFVESMSSVESELSDYTKNILLAQNTFKTFILDAIIRTKGSDLGVKTIDDNDTSFRGSKFYTYFYKGESLDKTKPYLILNVTPEQGYLKVSINCFIDGKFVANAASINLDIAHDYTKHRMNFLVRAKYFVDSFLGDNKPDIA
jgi:hypothetical protein